MARRRLQAYHDDELSISEQVAVAAHLEWCDGCSTALSDVRRVRVALRAATPGRIAFDDSEGSRLHRAVVGRIRVEKAFSFRARMHELFEDMHFVYAAAGGTVATVLCIIIMVAMMRFANNERPGSNRNPVILDARMLMPRVLGEVFVAEPATKGDDDAAFTLSGVVTREGRIVNLALHPSDGQAPAAGTSEAEAVESLIGAVSRARFEPARVDGLPVAVNMVLLVAHTTVRAAKDPLDGPMPSPKKRRASLISICVPSRLSTA
jgi:hypothetical protein